LIIKFDLIIVTGPTASGKTTFAAALAGRLNGEIISADSRQVYRGMDIGSGKDYDDYIVNGENIPVHLIDIVDPGYKYNVFEYQRDFLKCYNDIRNREKFPVVCGGSGMYVDSITSGYRLLEVPPDLTLRDKLEKRSMNELIGILKSFKELHNITDIDTKKRAIRAIEIEQYYSKDQRQTSSFPPIKSLVIGLNYERETRRRRISQRLRERFENGMVDEVKDLMDKGVSTEALIYYGLEYKYITLYLTGCLSYDEMFKSLEVAIHRFAKRQMTWFRGMERRGIKIHWLDGNLPLEEKVEIVLGWLSSS
jgi:tRNA dimethylallyltransferase